MLTKLHRPTDPTDQFSSDEFFEIFSLSLSLSLSPFYTPTARFYLAFLFVFGYLLLLFISRFNPFLGTDFGSWAESTMGFASSSPILPHLSSGQVKG
jgi:hypothetical protein